MDGKMCILMMKGWRDRMLDDGLMDTGSAVGPHVEPASAASFSNLSCFYCWNVLTCITHTHTESLTPAQSKAPRSTHPHLPAVLSADAPIGSCIIPPR